ncbi:hypothetical protein COCON_G00235910 [Conger conger]|uniref:Uncharacterized protein n=1 Tax=Conger conger TaxID=82655 RepID=A0A9Q1HIJ4_CONCO|nr:hypothetical protein COCON_G00235910 [Conger conger]
MQTYQPCEHRHCQLQPNCQLWTRGRCHTGTQRDRSGRHSGADLFCIISTSCNIHLDL